MALASTVILGSGSLETRDHILLPHDSGICATSLALSLSYLYNVPSFLQHYFSISLVRISFAIPFLATAGGSLRFPHILATVN
jgi:hypothetical protein